MTREEAIELVKSAFDVWEDKYSVGNDMNREHKARDMAIKALEQEPCEDCISRQSAIKAMLKIEQDDVEKYGCSIPEGFDSNPAINALNNLPTVTPQPKPSIDRVCDILAEMFETPCNYRFNEIDIDDFMSEDVYCENHCSDGCYGECWKRFFEKYDKFSKESE